MPILAISALALAAIHIASPLLGRLERVPRSRWLSFAGGVAVAYVFVHLLPDLAEAGQALDADAALGWLDRHAYLLALAGFGLFYALEAAAMHSRGGSRGEDAAGAPAGETVLWLHVTSFGGYNVLIGYLLAGWDEPESGSLLFAGALAVHLVVADYGLRDHHRHRFDGIIRWVLAAAVIAGFLAGTLLGTPDRITHLALAFLAGAVILNTMTEELPRERQSRVLPFLLGSAGYAAVLLSI